MKKIAILSPDAVPLTLTENCPEFILEDEESYQIKDKCSRTTAPGKRAWKMAQTLAANPYFQVDLFIPDLNYPGDEYIDKRNLNFTIRQYNYKSVAWNWSEELDRKLQKFDFVIIQTTAGAGFQNCAVLPSNVNVIVDGWVPLLAEMPVALLGYHRIHRKFHWERFLPQYHDLLTRANCVLYANDRQHYYYEGQFFSINKIGWKAFKFSPLLKVPYGVDITQQLDFSSRKEPGKLKLLWYGPVYPWYNPELLIETFINHPNISIDFMGVKHPRYKKIYKSYFKKFFDKIEQCSNIKIIEDYQDTPEELFKQYDASILIAQNWLEEKYSHRARIFEILSHGMPIIINIGNAFMEEHPYLTNRGIFPVNSNNIKSELEKYIALEPLFFSKEAFEQFQQQSKWKTVLKPLEEYIQNF